MKKLELEQMEVLQGGGVCEYTLGGLHGVGIGMMPSGFFLPIGIGLVGTAALLTAAGACQ